VHQPQVVPYKERLASTRNDEIPVDIQRAEHATSFAGLFNQSKMNLLNQ
jgi:hypothetical protein